MTPETATAHGAVQASIAKSLEPWLVALAIVLALGGLSMALATFVEWSWAPVPVVGP